MQKLKMEVKQKIMEVGKLKFKILGFENTSMKDIASDAGISTGNIYRYFLTKKHLLNEILDELEGEINELLDDISSNHELENLHEAFEKLTESTVKLAENNTDTLKIMFNSPNESQFVNFKNRILDTLMIKMSFLTEKMNNNQMDQTLQEAIARAEFEGFIHIVKKNIDTIDTLRKNLSLYEELMIRDLVRNIENGSNEKR